MEGIRRNRLYLSDIIDKHCPKLFFLQETWLPHFCESDLNKEYPEYNFLTSCDDMFTHAEDRLNTNDHVWHGTATAWHQDLHSLVKPLKVTHERFSGIKITSDYMSMLAISAYFPTSGKDDEFSECLSHLSNYIEENTEPDDGILISADTNHAE